MVIFDLDWTYFMTLGIAWKYNLIKIVLHFVRIKKESLFHDLWKSEKTYLCCISANNLQFNSLTNTFFSQFDELRGDFCFTYFFHPVGLVVNVCSCFQESKRKNIFQKHPPRFLFYFKQVKGLLIFFSKTSPFFRFAVQTSEGYKKFFWNRAIFGVHFDPLCPN